jgi:hypothetical protein
MLKKLIQSSSLIALLLMGCYPIGPEFVEDYDATYTILNDVNFDFADPTRQTYHLADTVIVLTDPNTSPTDIQINQAAILARVRTNMNQLGYTEIPDIDDAIDDADYLILVSVNRSDNYFYTWWPGWVGWPGWPGWGWGGCCFFPPTVTSTNIRTGAILVDLIDARALKLRRNELPEVWIGLGEGLFRGSQQNINNRALESIDQMFRQSPYLKR